MNLLLTNAQETQAYIIVRCLRHAFTRIVITTGSSSIGGSAFPGLAAFSRLVDASYSVPQFSADWLAGRISETNTRDEEVYVRQIEEICVTESIDVIFPSLDPEVYLFAKNKERFAINGVLCVVPEQELLEVPLNKALTIRAAQQVGFPTPKTFFPVCRSDLDQVIAGSEGPWVLKPRYGAHQVLLTFVESVEELRAGFDRISRVQPRPLVQKWVPGEKGQNYYVMLDRKSEILSILCAEVVRSGGNGRQFSTSVARSRSHAPYLAELSAMFKMLKLWGTYTIQTKLDPADGRPKLLEVNARFGHHLWYRTELGVNEPMMMLRLARHEQVEHERYPVGVLMVDPYCDTFRLARSVLETVGRWLARPVVEDRGEQKGLVIRELWKRYGSLESKIYCPEFRYLAHDPYPMLRRFSFDVINGTRGLARRRHRRTEPPFPAGPSNT